MPKRKRKKYWHECRHCGEVYTSTSKFSRYKPGHSPKPQKYRDADGTIVVQDPNYRIPARVKFPTVEEAMSNRPAACGKCGGAAIVPDHDHVAVDMNYGTGLSWRCINCGWVGFGVPGRGRAA